MPKAKNKAELDRLAKAQEIAQNPKGYMICEGCDSIVGEEVVTCPNCHAYLFDADPGRVAEQAIILGQRTQTSVTPADLV